MRLCANVVNFFEADTMPEEQLHDQYEPKVTTFVLILVFYFSHFTPGIPVYYK
ncbi:MAG TPA: hypothetical protein VMH01_00900 [Puia sp.]|nr:hypothetical protein [Puia sp.]